MKIFFLLFLFISSATFGQKLKKQDAQILNNLKTSVSILAADEMQGRRTGTLGEKLAYEYLSKEFSNIGLKPAGDAQSFLQKFSVNEGKEVLPETHLSINGKVLKQGVDYFPLSISGMDSVSAMVSPAIKESGAPWFLDIHELITDNSSNPHFDLESAIKTAAQTSNQKGANSLLVYNSGSENDALAFDGKSKAETVKIPVVYLNKEVIEKYLFNNEGDLNIQMKVAIGDKIRTGHNVVGFVDNQAENTIVIGAHYDHLGYGEDRNSLWTGTPEIHNGADDNASGTAAVLELARLLKNSKFKKNNYLFVCFSGEELGLYGSKSLVANPAFDASKINYMINMDMIGRLNDSKSITVGGYGTSPTWGKLIKPQTDNFSIAFDSSGIGPSDHTSFYLKDIPVLFFFTGTHSDYHKPTDDADKINYMGELSIVKYIFDLVGKTENEGKLAFLKTREPQMGNSAKFSVSLGVMPDYTYSGTGMHVDGVMDGKAAEKAGIKTGDIIVAIGDYEVSEINSYMSALSKFKKGDAARVKVKRGNEELVFDVTF